MNTGSCPAVFRPVGQRDKQVVEPRQDGWMKDIPFRINKLSQLSYNMRKIS